MSVVVMVVDMLKLVLFVICILLLCVFLIGFMLLSEKMNGCGGVLVDVVDVCCVFVSGFGLLFWKIYRLLSGMFLNVLVGMLKLSVSMLGGVCVI